MTQTVIHSQFEKFKAQEAAGGRRVVLNEFVFAMIPGLDIHSAPDKNATMPPESQIVHRQAPDSVAMVNENAVTYTVTLDATLPPFSFNWLALCNRDEDVTGMIIHLPVQQKLQTAGGMQGNVLTYAAIMEYEGAAQQTGVTVSAASWQVDFSARLGGIDELTRLNSLELYGRAMFFDEAFRVVKQESESPAASASPDSDSDSESPVISASPASAMVLPGTAYIRGLRVTTEKPVSVIYPLKAGFTLCMDVVFSGNITGEHKARFTLINHDTDDYIDALGRKHYVQALARVKEDGAFEDLRVTGKPVMQFVEDLTGVKDNLKNQLEAFKQQFADIERATEKKVADMQGLFLQKELVLEEIKQAGTEAQSKARHHLGLGTMALLNSLDGEIDIDAILPVGIWLPWPTDTAPPGWALMQGQTFDTIRYPKLARVFPKGVIPDMSGQVVKGKTATRQLLSFEPDGVKEHSVHVTVNPANIGVKATSNYNHGNLLTSTNGSHRHEIHYRKRQSPKGGWVGYFDGIDVRTTGYNPAEPVLPEDGMFYSATAGDHRHTVNVGFHSHTVDIGSHTHSATGWYPGERENKVKNIAANFIVRLA